MFFKKSELKLDVIDGNSSREVLAYGEGLMNVKVMFNLGLAEDTTIPLHKHVHVQSTYVLQGAFKFQLKYSDHTDTQIVRTGDSIYFPSNVEHGCIPLEDDSQLLDSFTPIREDFLKN